MSPIIESIKSSASTFHEKLEAKMAEKGKKINQLRAKVIVFRDYYDPDTPQDLAMVCSEFYNLRNQISYFEEFISKIEADWGGDAPENALEALALAFQSDWESSQNFRKQRYVIVLWTDTNVHSLERQPKPSHYPKGIPATLDALKNYWLNMSSFSKRLLLFAPEIEPWSLIQGWECTIHFPSVAGEGLAEFEMNEILEAIAGSI